MRALLVEDGYADGMRTHHLRAILSSVLLVAATTGGLPCYNCPEQPAQMDTFSPYPATLPDAGPEAGFFVDDAGLVQLTGEAGVPLAVEACAMACGTTYVTACSLEPGAPGAVLACDLEQRPGDCPGGRRPRGGGPGRGTPPPPGGGHFRPGGAPGAASGG